jgi:alcohol dehydrogenase YqhD (iron-dependent ADH family)
VDQGKKCQRKVWRLAFTDDLVIVAKSVREMKEMMKNLGRYVRKKKLEVNVEKIKMMVFNKRKRRSEENEWNWEEMKAMDETHIREIVRKARKSARY